ncbi:MAG: hypothetical protein PWP23_713 [Candidatus Sumerlaeota bacterium]|nr:hypothetical protein [Candidatus Sumerlaeota bacterium]
MHPGKEKEGEMLSNVRPQTSGCRWFLVLLLMLGAHSILPAQCPADLETYLSEVRAAEQRITSVRADVAVEAQWEKTHSEIQYQAAYVDGAWNALVNGRVVAGAPAGSAAQMTGVEPLLNNRRTHKVGGFELGYWENDQKARLSPSLQEARVFDHLVAHPGITTVKLDGRPIYDMLDFVLKNPDRAKLEFEPLNDHQCLLTVNYFRDGIHRAKRTFTMDHRYANALTEYSWESGGKLMQTLSVSYQAIEPDLFYPKVAIYTTYNTGEDGQARVQLRTELEYSNVVLNDIKYAEQIELKLPKGTEVINEVLEEAVMTKRDGVTLSDLLQGKGETEVIASSSPAFQEELRKKYQEPPKPLSRSVFSSPRKMAIILGSIGGIALAMGLALRLRKGK